jgi:hypothetical protein
VSVACEVVEGDGVCGIDDACEDVVSMVEGKFADELLVEQMVFDFAVHRIINSIVYWFQRMYSAARLDDYQYYRLPNK